MKIDLYFLKFQTIFKKELKLLNNNRINYEPRRTNLKILFLIYSLGIITSSFGQQWQTEKSGNPFDGFNKAAYIVEFRKTPYGGLGAYVVQNDGGEKFMFLKDFVYVKNKSGKNNGFVKIMFDDDKKVYSFFTKRYKVW